MPQVKYYVDADGHARSVKTKKLLKGTAGTLDSARYCLEGSECLYFNPKRGKKYGPELPPVPPAQVLAAGRRRR